MIHYYFQHFIQFAQHHRIMFVLTVVTVFFALFLLIILLINPKKQPEPIIDIKAIAGDDEVVTQLDLARAYIELGKQKLAEKILKNVIQQGNHDQKQTAQELLSTL